MPNPYMPRDVVHAWSDQIGEQAVLEQSSLARLLRDQRRLSKFIEENASNMAGPSAGVCLYLTGVIARMFDLAGGRLRSATWAQVRTASSRVQEAASGLMPIDETFAERARAVTWRAQPHILDEALMSLFERTPGEEEEDLPFDECAKIYFLLWVATEVLDENWRPAKGFEGLADYVYVHIESAGGDEAGEAEAGEDKNEAGEAQPA